jgi:hypothetical protein
MTTYTALSHVAVGDPITAAAENTLRDNVKAVWENGASGKMLYYPTSTTIGGVDLPVSYAGLLRQTTAGVLSWQEPFSEYQIMRADGTRTVGWSNLLHITVARRSTDLTHTRNNVITWNSSDTDDDSQHSTSVNTSRVTLATTGIFFAVLYLKMSIGNGDWAMDAQLRLNGTQFGGNAGWGGNGGGATRYFGCSGIVEGLSTNYIEAFLDWNGTGTTSTIYIGSHLTVLRLR